MVLAKAVLYHSVYKMRFYAGFACGNPHFHTSWYEFSYDTRAKNVFLTSVITSLAFGSSEKVLSHSYRNVLFRNNRVLKSHGSIKIYLLFYASYNWEIKIVNFFLVCKFTFSHFLKLAILILNHSQSLIYDKTRISNFNVFIEEALRKMWNSYCLLKKIRYDAFTQFN